MGEGKAKAEVMVSTVMYLARSSVSYIVDI